MTKNSAQLKAIRGTASERVNSAYHGKRVSTKGMSSCTHACMQNWHSYLAVNREVCPLGELVRLHSLQDNAESFDTLQSLCSSGGQGKTLLATDALQTATSAHVPRPPLTESYCRSRPSPIPPQWKSPSNPPKPSIYVRLLEGYRDLFLADGSGGKGAQKYYHKRAGPMGRGGGQNGLPAQSFYNLLSRSYALPVELRGRQISKY